VAEIQRKVIKQGGRGAVSRLFSARSDKEVIAGWKAELNRILLVFNVRSIVLTLTSLTVPFQTELVVNIHVAVSDIRHDVSKMSKIQEESGGQVRSVSASPTQFINRRMFNAV